MRVSRWYSHPRYDGSKHHLVLHKHGSRWGEAAAAGDDLEWCWASSSIRTTLRPRSAGENITPFPKGSLFTPKQLPVTAEVCVSCRCCCRAARPQPPRGREGWGTARRRTRSGRSSPCASIWRPTLPWEGWGKRMQLFSSAGTQPDDSSSPSFLSPEI